MKLKYILIVVVIIGLFGSCKSKKTAVKKVTKKEVVVIKSKKQTTKTTNSPITNRTINYINTYKKTAMESMRKYKIPASITLAQGILESSSGNSELTRKSNNHFGIKCHKGWKGKRVYHDDDKKDDCFRVYKDPANSFKDHSLFLTGRTRYAKLFKFKKGDYVKWAKGLSEAGYATDRRYPAKLIALIEKYNLHKYDTEVLGKSFKKKTTNPVTNHIVLKGDTLYSISKKYGLTVEELKRFNGLNSNEINIGQTLSLIK
ncbi:MAG: LysM peptidoglycan-binding domain-containing protein [Lutibacter sp.]|uniref:glucosaminidase domain-containing protein n=1 Tax=Lutibacter sp. TaxID=1925666 RepID=UPI0019F8794F|nr:glucosaminidase domain-containing protein [Lutibacter sp.]NOR27254.1 LysM peptidoglycan-binding domain-containing protein [Lutibacter sp.]